MTVISRDGPKIGRRVTRSIFTIHFSCSSCKVTATAVKQTDGLLWAIFAQSQK